MRSGVAQPFDWDDLRKPFDGKRPRRRFVFARNEVGLERKRAVSRTLRQPGLIIDIYVRLETGDLSISSIEELIKDAHIGSIQRSGSMADVF